MKHRIVTAAQMKEIERAGDAHGLPYLQMMEKRWAGCLVVVDVTPPPRQTACGSPSESPGRRAPDISGTQFDRPGFQKMIAEVKADRISVVIIW